MTISPAPYRENSRLRYKWVLSLAAPSVTKHMASGWKHSSESQLSDFSPRSKWIASRVSSLRRRFGRLSVLLAVAEPARACYIRTAYKSSELESRQRRFRQIHGMK